MVTSLNWFGTLAFESWGWATAKCVLSVMSCAAHEPPWGCTLFFTRPLGGHPKVMSKVTSPLHGGGGGALPPAPKAGAVARPTISGAAHTTPIAPAPRAPFFIA